MKNCPNCKKEYNKRFEYCRICGSKLNGESVGDFSTEIKNLFRNGEFYYLFAINGNQVIIKGKTIEEVKNKVSRRNFPWIENKDYKGQSKESNFSEEDVIEKEIEEYNSSEEIQNSEFENKEIFEDDYDFIQTKHIKLGKEETDHTMERTITEEEKGTIPETSTPQEENETIPETSTPQEEKEEEKETIILKAMNNEKTPIKKLKEEPYVTSMDDVNFGKIVEYDPITGQKYERWGPDNTERAKKLRKDIFKRGKI